MKYIYDIILNFNEELYEFYEWKDEDYFDYIKKIPIIKVTKETVKDIMKNRIMINSDFIKTINNACEVYTNNSVKTIEYACIFCSNSTIIAVEFNYKGISIMKSDLLIDEGLDIIEYCKKIKPMNLEYKIICNDEKKLITRKEEEMINFMKREINNIYKDNNFDKLKYIYFECFNKIEDNILKIYEELKNHINSLPPELYNILMLSYKSLQK